MKQIVFIQFLLAMSFLTAATYYVDANGGNDNSNGLSVSTPWKTILKVSSTTFNPIDKILFKNGDLFEGTLIITSSGIKGSPITYATYGASLSAPVINAYGKDYAVYLNKKSYINIENLSLKNANRNNLRAEGINDNITLSFVASTNARDGAGYEFDSVSGINIYNSRADYNRGSTMGYGFLFKGSCSNILLRDSTASYNLRRGAQFDTGISGYIKVLGGQYHHQYGNNQSDGVSIDANNNILVEGVWAHDNGVSTDGSADGIQVSGGSENAIIRYNKITNNNNAGIVLEVKGGNIYYNISRNNRHGIAVGENSKNNLNIYNNTTYNNEFGIFIYQSTPKSRVNIYNNLFYGASDMQRAAYLETGLSDKYVYMDYNDFWGDNNEYLIEWKGKLYTRSNFKTFQKNTNKNKKSIAIDPKFIDVSNYNYHLNSNSPCINKGKNVGLTRDFDGKAIVGLPDIGAFEK